MKLKSTFRYIVCFLQRITHDLNELNQMYSLVHLKISFMPSYLWKRALMYLMFFSQCAHMSSPLHRLCPDTGGTWGDGWGMVSPGEWRAPGVLGISQHQAAAPWPPSLWALTLAGSTTGDLHFIKCY